MENFITNLPLLAKYVFITLFFIVLIREIICWYFKINKRVRNQEIIIAELKKLNSRGPFVNRE